MPQRDTILEIRGDRFHVNGRPTYEGASYAGRPVEGLLMNARMVQAIFDDLNPETRHRWTYPDGSAYSADRNTREFLAMMPAWRRAGLVGIGFNLQGGCPLGYADFQPWHNSTFALDGSLRPAYLERLEAVLDRADELGMVVILGLFYFGQDHRLYDERRVRVAVDNITDWLLERGYTNLLVEIANEIDAAKYVHEILKPPRGHELMQQVRKRSTGRLDTPAGRLLVGNSFCGGRLPTPNVVEASDAILLHGNGVDEPDGIRRLVDETCGMDAYKGQPILFNEDDHFNFDAADCNMKAAVERYAGWGLFDWRAEGEDFSQGYQNVPVDWGTNSDRKRGFFRLLAEMTGGEFPLK